jgi:hypothetical protein
MEHQQCLFYQNYHPSPEGIRAMAGEGTEAGTAYSCNTSSSHAGRRGITASFLNNLNNLSNLFK